MTTVRHIKALFFVKCAHRS